MCGATDRPSHARIVFQSQTYICIYRISDAQLFSPHLSSFSHITKKSSFGIQSIAVHDEEATAVKSNWRFMEIDGDEYHSLSSLSLSLCHTNMDSGTLAHGHTSSPSRCYMKSTHNYTASCSQLQENLSAASVVSVGSASLLSLQPHLPWWG